MRRVVALALLIAFASPLFAQDNRIRQIEYDRDRVVSVSGTRGVQTMIEFGEDERIENIALGDSAVWQVTPSRSGKLLFVKPLADRANTNMTVITSRRHYLFELRTGLRTVQPVYVLRFSYPAPLQLVDEGQDAANAVPLPSANPEAPAVRTLPEIAARNRGWSTSGSKELIPGELFDDGRSTYLAWPADRELPVVLTTGPDGVEGAANYTLLDGFIVIEGVERAYIVRIGKTSATLRKSGTAPAQNGSKQ